MRSARRLRLSSMIAAAMLMAGCATTRSTAPDVTPSSSATSTCTSTTMPSTTSTSSSSTSSTSSSAVAPTTVSPTTVSPTTVTRTTVPRTTVPATTTPSGPSSATVWRLPTSQHVVAITFDAGSDLGYTQSVLDTLAAKGVAASFGITGAWADAHPAEVHRMAAEGHQVINHTYTHHSFTGASATNPILTTAGRQAELARAEATLSALIGCSTKPFWRPPYGDTNASVLADVGAAGYRYTIMWTVDSQGWKGLPAADIVTRVLSLASPGAILAFHVGSASQDALALAQIIDGLRAQGYTFTTLGDAYGL